MSNLSWKEIDPTTLSKAQQDAYNAYKTAYSATTTKRKAFEALVTADMAKVLPAGRGPVFGYRFGKLSLAIGEAKAAAGVSKKAVTLADYLAANA